MPPELESQLRDAHNLCGDDYFPIVTYCPRCYFPYVFEFRCFPEGPPNEIKLCCSDHTCCECGTLFKVVGTLSGELLCGECQWRLACIIKLPLPLTKLYLLNPGRACK